MCITIPAKQMDPYYRIIVEADDASCILIEFCCKMHVALLQKALLQWKYFLFSYHRSACSRRGGLCSPTVSPQLCNVFPLNPQPSAQKKKRHPRESEMTEEPFVIISCTLCSWWAEQHHDYSQLTGILTSLNVPVCFNSLKWNFYGPVLQAYY